MNEPSRLRVLTWSLAWRFLRGRRSRLLDATAQASLVATTLGVAAMVIAMALMTGYRTDLQSKLLRGDAAVVAYPLSPDGGELPLPTRQDLLALDGVTDVRRVTYGQGGLASEARPDGLEVTLRGVEAGKTALAGFGSIDLEPGVDSLVAPAGELPKVVLGQELARKLEVGEGAVLRLMALGFEARRPRFRYRSMRVVGIFRTGFSEFDESWVLVDRQHLEILLGRGAGASLLEIGVDEVDRAQDVAAAARQVLGSDFLVTDWLDLNRELFTALRVQQIALFFVLGLIVVVSTFNVASSLVVLVRDRMRDVGVLAALGMAPSQLRRVFLIYGGALGTVGAALGVALGCGVAWFLTAYEIIRFDPEMAAIYFISSVPFRVRALDVLAVTAFTLGVTFLSCWLPARQAGRVRPATALRYE